MLTLGRRSLGTKRVALLANDPAKLGALLKAAGCYRDAEVTAVVPVSQQQEAAVLQRATDTVGHAPRLTRIILATSSNSPNNAAPGLAAEEAASLALQLQEQHRFTHWLALHDAFGKNCLPRLAALLDAAASLPDVVAIAETAGTETDTGTTYTRNIYAGNAVARIRAATDAVHCVSIRSTAFIPEKEGAPGPPVRVETFRAATASGAQVIVEGGAGDGDGDRGVDVQTARVVVAGGRALRDAETFGRVLGPLARALHGALGASRAAVDAGFCANDLQIGQTGKIIAPDLYVAVGISGAIQHVAGIQDARVIVAINKDPECAMLGIADYGLVGDLYEIVPELTRKLSELSEQGKPGKE